MLYYEKGEMKAVDISAATRGHSVGQQVLCNNVHNKPYV